MKKRHGRRGRIACFNNTACEQRVICVWMKITTRHSIPSQMPMQMIQWWTSADVHHVVPCYRIFFLWFSVEKFFSFFFFLFLFLFTLDREIAFDSVDAIRGKIVLHNSYLFYDEWYLKRVLNLLIEILIYEN